MLQMDFYKKYNKIIRTGIIQKVEFHKNRDNNIQE